MWMIFQMTSNARNGTPDTIRILLLHGIHLTMDSNAINHPWMNTLIFQFLSPLVANKKLVAGA